MIVRQRVCRVWQAVIVVVRIGRVRRGVAVAVVPQGRVAGERVVRVGAAIVVPVVRQIVIGVRCVVVVIIAVFVVPHTITVAVDPLSWVIGERIIVVWGAVVIFVVW